MAAKDGSIGYIHRASSLENHLFKFIVRVDQRRMILENAHRLPELYIPVPPIPNELEMIKFGASVVFAFVEHSGDRILEAITVADKMLPVLREAKFV